MLFSHTATLPQSRTPRRLRLAAAAGAALLTVGAISAWQSSGSDDTLRTTAPVAAPSISQPAPIAPVSSARTSVGRSHSDNATVYLVRSPEEAASVQAAIDEAELTRDQFETSVFRTSILVATSAEEEQALVSAHADTNAIRAGLGLSPVTLINLRTR